MTPASHAGGLSQLLLRTIYTRVNKLIISTTGVEYNIIHRERFGAAVARWAYSFIYIIYYNQLAYACNCVYCVSAQKVNKKESFSTYGSRVVPHLSTRQAQWCLTAEFGWDLVFPPWYDRMTVVLYKFGATLSNCQLLFCWRAKWYFSGRKS